jgi:hypothetical protein
MHSPYRLIPFSVRLLSLIVCLVNFAAGAVPLSPTRTKPRLMRFASVPAARTAEFSNSENSVSYKWNVDERQLPLLALPEHLAAGLERSLTYPLDQFRLPIFEALKYDDEHGKYLLPLISQANTGVHFIEFQHSASRNTFTSIDGTNIQLVDNDTLKTFRTSDGTKYIFVRYPDGEFRCATIKQANGAYLNLLYAANGLTLHGVIDSCGRTISFEYSSDGIKSVTQSWIANSEGVTKRWLVGDQVDDVAAKSVKYSHAEGFLALKSIPANAVIRLYTAEMAASDKILAQIFGGPNSVAGANGFEPAGLAAAYPLYRGDIIGDDAKLRRGHLSYAMHLYGGSDGQSDSPLYVPAGFTSHSSEPSPTDAAVTFYYPRLGSLTDVTVAIFHVANFQISYEGERVRIGNIGGPGGSSAFYKHSHIEFYKGNTGLPSTAARASLRIDPSTIFSQAFARKGGSGARVGQQ